MRCALEAPGLAPASGQPARTAIDGSIGGAVRLGWLVVRRVAMEGVTLGFVRQCFRRGGSRWARGAGRARAGGGAKPQAAWGRAAWRWVVVAAMAGLARPAGAGDIHTAAPSVAEPITVAADSAMRWKEGVYDVWRLAGNCYLNQGLTYARGPEAVLWIEHRDPAAGPTKVIAYFEGTGGQAVVVDFRQPKPDAGQQTLLGQQRGATWFQRLQTTAPLRWHVPAAAAPTERPAIYDRGLEQFDPQRRRQLLLAQFTDFAPSPEGGQALPPGMVRINVSPRSDSAPDFEVLPQVNGQNIIIGSGGVRVTIEGLQAEGLPMGLGPIGVIDVSTDRVVIWKSAASGMTTASTQAQSEPLEIYMEGNIEFRQGDRVVYADRMFYDVRRQVGVILNAELISPLPAQLDYSGVVRIKAAAVRQLDASRFAAQGALVTTSRLGEPTYDVTANQILYTDVEQPVVDPLTGAPLVHPDGTPVVERRQLAEAQGNVVHIQGVPVFYWPVIATDLEKPSFIIDSVRVGNDSIFGTQAAIDWDAYQLLGVERIEGTDWGLSTDYLSERGFGVGTDFQYDRPEIFGLIGPARGNLDFWAISDDGLDNLGRGRQSIDPEEDFRFRLLGEHRQYLENGWTVTAESGWLSDRTFQEQFFEQDWDERREARTGVRGRKIDDNREWMVEANAQVNDFYSETQYLPRLDHYWLGTSLLDDRITWFEHSSAAYAEYEVAAAPSEPTLAAQWVPLPWDAQSSGERLFTTHEFDLPLQLGEFKVVPYALGQLYHVGEAIDGDSLDRAYVNAGVRGSIPFWAVYPDVRDPLFNLNGLAHKVVFEMEASYADASQNFDELPLYDQLDDTSILEFRRRLSSGALDPTITDPKFDPRRFAIRQGLGDWVTNPSAETVDDLIVVRMGVRQRWQTKRGLAGNQHIVDWLTLDMNASYFPDPNRDNFGQEFGLLDYDLRWHLGDRFTIVSDGFADVFGDGLKTVSGGVLINRPTLGNAYFGVRSINGPVASNVLLASLSYRLSEKWITTAGAAYDFEQTGNIGQSMSVTRIGESMLMTVGLNVDEAKDNVGVNFLLEPRFLPKSRVTRTTGIVIPPAGAMGLE
ncbi:MAG: organic solvent tolerance protein OstA [Planctomycetota bacterium]|nr:MAG: organic solvent tolerance protein OstA [Planctomycetota bacterium]